MTGSSIINQKGAKAGRDIVAGDKVDHHHYPPTAKASVVEALMAKLQKEMEQSSQVTAMIDELCHYHQHKAHDGVTGLEAKLQKGQRSHEIDYALDQKEQFAKILEKWSMYASAQEIFVHLLARAEIEYRAHVLPQLDALTEVQVNEAITTRIVNPIVADCGNTVFKLNHGTAMGMFYWLAEQCFVRWHK
jgi:hypothetical protein